MIDTLQNLLPAFVFAYVQIGLEFGQSVFGDNWPSIILFVWTALKVVLIVGPLLLGVAYTTYIERKVIGWMQVRIGPNRVGPLGLIQPLADGLKLLLKEVTIPTGADKFVFLLAPVFAFLPALISWSVIPFSDFLVVANVNASLLFVMAVTSISVYGIILAGWSSNSKYAFLGSMRSAAQMISYEVSMGMSLVVVMMVSNSLNITDIVTGQSKGYFADMGLTFLSWNWLPLLPMFVVYLVSLFAECGRAPFDLPEGESEIVGYHVEYAGMSFAVFQLAEYSAMILGTALVSLLFLGGWTSPVSFIPDSALWLFVKMLALLVVFFWARATFPRYRYDQVMRLGWKVFIPLCLIWLLFIGCWMMSPWNIWK